MPRVMLPSQLLCLGKLGVSPSNSDAAKQRLGAAVLGGLHILYDQVISSDRHATALSSSLTSTEAAPSSSGRDSGYGTPVFQSSRHSQLRCEPGRDAVSIHLCLLNLSHIIAIASYASVTCSSLLFR